MTNALKINIEEFVRIHQQSLRSYVRLLGCHESSVDDVAQEAFLIFLRKGQKVEDKPAALAYLRRCARNLLRDSNRNAMRRDAILRQDAAEVIWQRFQLDERPSAYRESLQDCLHDLPGHLRIILDQFYADGMSGPEVAAASGLSESDVWTSIHRSRERLRKCIERKLKHET